MESVASEESINPDWVPVINRQFRLQWEDAQDCFVLLYPEGMIKLNPSAGEILNQCNGSHSAGEIVDSLQQKFPDAGDISADIFEFFGIARQQRWLNHE